MKSLRNEANFNIESYKQRSNGCKSYSQVISFNIFVKLHNKHNTQYYTTKL